MSDTILVHQSDGICEIRFNRPEKKNAITLDMYDRLTAALKEGEADPATRCHLLLGREGVFTAGNDLMDFMAVAAGGDHAENAIHFLRTLASTRKPVVAAVDGLAIGIGTTLLMHCDLVYATPSVRFKTPFLDLGLVPEAASSMIAPRLMGYQRAFELLCLGEAFTAEQARDAGLVNAIVDAEEVEEIARNAARRLAAKPPEALAIARALIRGDNADILARIDEERTHFSARLKSDEARAAFEAFLGR